MNRELAALGRIATLARKQYGLVAPFLVDPLVERNARQGFFEAEALAAVCRGLAPRLATLALAASLTGWRKSELRSRQWRHVDFAAGWLRLDPEETKNRDGRMFPLIPELRVVLEAQRARAEACQRETGRIIPWVFFQDRGTPVGDFKHAWATACIKAGFFRVVQVDAQTTVKVPTLLFHDLRRTAVRNLIRRGVPQPVAMKLTGHRTTAVFHRYAIVDEAMLVEAGAKLTGLAWPDAATVSAAPSKVGRVVSKVARGRA